LDRQSYVSGSSFHHSALNLQRGIEAGIKIARNKLGNSQWPPTFPREVFVAKLCTANWPIREVADNFQGEGFIEVVDFGVGKPRGRVNVVGLFSASGDGDNWIVNPIQFLGPIYHYANVKTHTRRVNQPVISNSYDEYRSFVSLKVDGLNLSNSEALIGLGSLNRKSLSHRTPLLRVDVGLHRNRQKYQDIQRHVRTELYALIQAGMKNANGHDNGNANQSASDDVPQTYWQRLVLQVGGAKGIAIGLLGLLGIAYGLTTFWHGLHLYWGGNVKQ
jgi:hypothetical protein